MNFIISYDFPFGISFLIKYCNKLYEGNTNLKWEKFSNKSINLCLSMYSPLISNPFFDSNSGLYSIISFNKALSPSIFSSSVKLILLSSSFPSILFFSGNNVLLFISLFKESKMS